MDLEKLLLIEPLGIQGRYVGTRDVPHYRCNRNNICLLIDSE